VVTNNTVAQIEEKCVVTGPNFICMFSDTRQERLGKVFSKFDLNIFKFQIMVVENTGIYQ